MLPEAVHHQRNNLKHLRQYVNMSLAKFYKMMEKYYTNVYSVKMIKIKLKEKYKGQMQCVCRCQKINILSFSNSILAEDVTHKSRIVNQAKMRKLTVLLKQQQS